MIPNAFHSGDLGDIIYSLPFLRFTAPRSNLYLSASTYTDVPMTAERAEFMASLLRLQPYIQSCGFGVAGQGLPLDHFRALAMRNPTRPLAELYFMAFGYAPYRPSIDRPWLRVDKPERVAQVIINRTARYQNDADPFPWRMIVDKYGGDLAFVGSLTEHLAFCQEFGNVRYHEIDTALDIARVIAGADAFFGNQSLCYAIAEGLKVRTFQETSPKMPNCIYPRENASYGHPEGL